MSYYDLEIGQIPIGRNECPRIIGTSTGPVHCLPFDAKIPTLKEWEGIAKSCDVDDADNYACIARITDNGENGDGCLLEISAFAGYADSILRIPIPEESLDTLIAALETVRRLRNAEG